MFHDPRLTCARKTEFDLRAFLDAHAAAIYNALVLLRGLAGGQLHARLWDRLQSDPGISRQCRNLLISVADILALRHLEFADPEDEAHFTAIDPGAPVVEEICLISEPLGRLLTDIGSDLSDAA